MDNEKQNISRERAHLSRRRLFIVIGRWALVALWAAVVLFGPAASTPLPIASFIKFAVLSFLLANALWQHMGLFSACVVAVLATCVLGLVDGVVSFMVPDYSFSSLDWIVGAIGALVGGIVAYPALRVIDSFISSDL